MPLITLQNITKQYAGHTALSDVSLTVPEGSIFGLLGPNGAGKTTLIRIINQIIAQDSGLIFFDNREMTPDDVSMIGYLPEERGLYKKMKVGEQALYLGQLKGLSRREAEKRLRHWFSVFEISGWWNRRVEELSKGMQQKIQFIITVLHQPRLLIFDEPFSGFDPINVNILKEEILNLKKGGSTIIFSTHNMASVEELCDQIALIDRSKKVLDGPVKAIRKQFASNTFEIRYNGFHGELAGLLPEPFTIVSCDQEEDIESVRIRLPLEKGPNDLLTLLIPYLTIFSLNEVVPSMHDIFIQVVTEKEASA